MEIEFRAERRPLLDRIDLYARHRATNGVAYARPLVMESCEAAVVPEPVVSLPMEDAQTLMDELWRAGIRPTEGAGSAGSMAATERHLKDMQSITFGLLKKDGVAV